MPRRNTNAEPKWTDVKLRLDEFDRLGLIALIQDLYAASKDNRNFLHARLAIGANRLEPYKKSLQRWLYPNVLRDNEDVSVSKALKTIADYRKAVRDPEGLLELNVFYCEQASGFSEDVGMAGDSWFNALARVFADALDGIAKLPQDRHPGYIARLEKVRDMSQSFGWGVGDEMNDLWGEYGLFELED